MAKTEKVWVPFLTLPRNGERQATGGLPSSEHRNFAGSFAVNEKEKGAVLLPFLSLTTALGRTVILLCGGMMSGPGPGSGSGLPAVMAIQDDTFPARSRRRT